jgi:hypothetical protein
MLIPDCCRGPYVYIDNEETVTSLQSAPSNLQIYALGEGEPSGFGEHNLTGYAIRGTPDSSEDWSILTNTNVSASLPAVIKVRKIGHLPFEIRGPGCSGFGEYTLAATEEVTEIRGTRIKILRAPGTGCGYAVEIWNGSNWVPVSPTTAPELEDVGVVECGETRGRSGCQECIFATEPASPGEYWINLGGTWYKIII